MPLDRPVPAAQDQPMATERVRKLLAAAAELPTEERAQLVQELARTLPRIVPVGEPLASRFGALRHVTTIVDASDDLLSARDGWSVE